MRCQQIGHRRLQARKAEIAALAPQQRPRQFHARRAAGRQPLQRRAARPTEAQHLGHLIERLAHRVVDGTAQPAVLAYALHRHQLAVAAGNQQQQVRKRRAAFDQARQAWRQRMRFQMVDRHERLARGNRHPLGHPCADDQPANQPGPHRGSHRTQRSDGPVAKHLPHQCRQMMQMRSRRDFGHHAAKRGMFLLAQHGLCQHRPVWRQ